MNLIIYIPTIIAAAYLVASSLYQLTLALASKLNSKRSLKSFRVFKKFLVLIPAYKEDQVILNSLKKNMALAFQYPRTSFEMVVIADSLQDNTIKQIKGMGAGVVKVDFDESTKVKALQAAMKEYNRGYDGVVILDADNLMNWDFLHKMNTYLHNGYKVIQGQRAPFNKESDIAVLDGLAEIANHKMLCLGANNLGLSSKLSGSGMVFDFWLFKKVIPKLSAIGGFDKELELLFTKRGQKIAYAEEAIVYDEKVSSINAYEVQRGRWLEAQYSFFQKHWLQGLKALSHGKFDYFHKVFQLALPPRALAPFALITLSLLSFAFQAPALGITCGIGFTANISAYLLVLPFNTIKSEFFKTVAAIPKLLKGTLKALTLMKRSKTAFLHTPHQVIQS